MDTHVREQESLASLTPSALRERIETAIESLIDLLDEMDGSPDEEAFEPEEDDDPWADDSDDEPSLGALEVSYDDARGPDWHPKSDFFYTARDPFNQERAWSQGFSIGADGEWDILDQPHDEDEREEDIAERGLADGGALLLWSEECAFRRHWETYRAYHRASHLAGLREAMRLVGAARRTRRLLKGHLKEKAEKRCTIYTLPRDH